MADRGHGETAGVDNAFNAAPPSPNTMKLATCKDGSRNGQSKPATAFSPVASTPEELGDALFGAIEQKVAEAGPPQR